MHQFYTLFTAFLLTGTALAQAPVLVKDINPGLSSSITSLNAKVAGNVLYFDASDGVHGDELWKTDGTEAGTTLVKDIAAGDPGSQQKFYSVYKGQLYFTAYTPTEGIELWRTDDNAGAALVADPCPGDCNGAFYGTPYRIMAEYNGKLYFQLRAADTGAEPWVTDGTDAGTMLLRDINPGAGENSNPYGFTIFQDKLYFAADSSNVGSELWVTNGTAGGSHLVKNINTSYYGANEMDDPVVGSNAIYFWASTSNGNGKELWKSDGTPQGTVLLKDIGPGTLSGQPPYVYLSNSAWLGNQLLFTADNGTAGAELWITDGTSAGTQLLLDINPGTPGSNIQFLTTQNGKVFFRAKTETQGNELWTTDGTAAGTQLVKDINPGTGDGLHFADVYFAAHGSKIYFTGNNGTNGRELWVTDGTAAGTVQLFDMNAGDLESRPSNFQVLGNFLYFFATTLEKGRELWKLPLPTSATAEPGNTLACRLYPTCSSNGFFHLDYSGTPISACNVSVFNILGRLSYQVIQSPDLPLQLSNLPAGTYLVHVATANGQSTVQKVIITH